MPAWPCLHNTYQGPEHVLSERTCDVKCSAGSIKWARNAASCMVCRACRRGMQDDVAAADGPTSRSAPHSDVVARTFNYETERACDAHLATFLHSIEAAGAAPGQGFAAIKARSQLGSALRAELIEAVAACC